MYVRTYIHVCLLVIFLFILSMMVAFSLEEYCIFKSFLLGRGCWFTRVCLLVYWGVAVGLLGCGCWFTWVWLLVYLGVAVSLLGCGC